MARNVLPDQYYTFNASTRTITLNRSVKRESLLLITNVTTNTVIYNFSDPNLRATSYTQTQGALALSQGMSDVSTVIVLNYNTTSMSNTDKIQIIVDEYESKFVPGETLVDPVGKFRTSQPQALIDTDFEYSVQQTKWELLQLINNRPSMYLNINQPNTGRNQVNATTITSIVVSNASRVVTVNVASSTGFVAGQSVYIQDTQWNPANGTFLIEAVPGGTSFQYRAREAWTTGQTPSTDINDVNIPTQIFDAPFFTGSGLGGTITYNTAAGQVQQITTSLPHGLEVGNDVMLVNNATGAATNSAYGNHQVYTVLSPFIFCVYTDTTAAAAPTGASNSVFVRPPGYSMHRAFDGGVTFSTNTYAPNTQYIRQTRRYFRYQSGKGIQVSTGTALKTQIAVDRLDLVSGSTIIAYTKYAHGLYPGATVTVTGCTGDTTYNTSNSTVISVLDSYRFTYTGSGAPSTPVAAGAPQITANNWYNGISRTGFYDTQNGFFFEYDGQRLALVRRSSTYQVGGFCSITANDSTVTGLTVNGAGTAYSRQLAPNDFVVIRGMSYRVTSITADNSFKIIPPYRGQTNLTKGIISKTVDTVFPQSAWNMDKCDGTGPSGFTIDPGKMNMFYIDYSWYGAGFVRFGFRGADGQVIYVHKIVNNNVNTEAYMRSGNLPARYEASTIAKYTAVTSTLNSGDTTIAVASTAEFPNAGTVLVRSDTQTEYITYTNKTSNSLGGLTRGQAGNTGAGIAATLTSGQTVVPLASTTGLQIGQFVYTGTLGQIPQGTQIISFVTNTSVTLSKAVQASGATTMFFAPLGQTAQTFSVSQTTPVVCQLTHTASIAPAINHWGTSVIMDGRYDDDKSFVFTFGQNSLISIAANANNALMAIRVGPVVSNGNTSSLLGTRDLINRMQLVLRQLDINQTGTSGFLVTLVLNGTPSTNGTWLSQGGSSLAQVLSYAAGTTMVGGEVVGGFYTNPGSNTATTLDLNSVRDLGNGILGGGVAGAQTGMFPDGPDVIHVMVRNLNGASAQTIAGRLSWTEAQA
jgi:hypothetical protein